MHAPIASAHTPGSTQIARTVALGCGPALTYLRTRRFRTRSLLHCQLTLTGNYQRNLVSSITATTDLSIGEVCQQTDLSARTVRYWEELGLLSDVRRREAGRRVYGQDQLERLHFINRLKALGLSLQEIRDLNAVYAIDGSTDAMLSRLDQLLEGHLADIAERIDKLTTLRSDITDYRSHIEGRRS